MAGLNTRAASRDDAWNRVCDTCPRARITSIVVSGLPGTKKDLGLSFGDGALWFLCGANGTGKTQLTRLIVAALTDAFPEVDRYVMRRLAGAEVLLEIRLARSTEIVVARVLPDRIERQPLRERLDVVWLDPVAHALKLAQYYSTIDDLGAVLDAYEFRELKSDEREWVSLGAGRGYESIEVAEIEEGDGASVVPYFRVSVGGAAYGMESMGLGELCLLLNFWTIRMSAPSERPRLLLVEEPEAFLSPRLQRALADSIAGACSDRKEWALVTTHSPEIIYRTEDHSIQLLERRSDSIGVVARHARVQALERLSILPRPDLVLAVEDRAAAVLLNAILKADELNSWRHAVVRVAGDVQKVFGAVLSATCLGELVRVIGVLDGDQRNTADKEMPKVAYLPSDRPPDEMLWQWAIKHKSDAAKALSLSTERFDSASLVVSAFNIHDRFVELDKHFNFEHGTAVSAIAGSWASSIDSVEARRLLLSSLIELIEGADQRAVPRHC